MKQKMIKRKLLSFLLTLALVLGLVPWISLTAYADTSPVLWIGGVQVVTSGESSGTGWSYYAGTNTLTLNGANINTSYSFGTNMYAVVYYDGSTALNINLVGENSLSDEEASDNHCAYGIYSNSGLIISGAGKLKIKAGFVGIYANGDMTIESGELEANGGVNGINTPVTGVLTINGGKVTAKSTGTGGTKSGISAGYVFIAGGEVAASGQTFGIESSAFQSVDTGLSITGGNVTANGVYGIRASSNISISGGNVTASGSYGIAANNAEKTITINFADVTLVGTNRVISYGSLSTSVTPIVYTDAEGTVSAVLLEPGEINHLQSN